MDYKALFKLKYPNIDWNSLEIYHANGKSTNDGHIHYRSKLNGEIYSWNMFSKTWMKILNT